MAPQPFVNQTLGPAQLQSCNSVLKADTSKTQAVVILFRQLTEKICRLMLPILRWTLFQYDSWCHLGLLGGIRAALPTSWKNNHS